jgi:AmmeMemoRadiSam system protein A
MDGEGLAAKIQTDEAKACGGGPTAAVLMACKKAGVDGIRILKYDDSGTTSGDVSQVVGYVSAVAYREDEMGTERDRDETEEYLNHDEQVELLGIARQSIEAAVNGKPPPPHLPSEGKLTEDGAAFVTITIGGHLRGCIGYTMAMMPLYQCVSECAVSAAMRDPRFSPLTPREYRDIDIEISVLTPLVEIDDIGEIEVGRDGLMISKMGRRGLLLPQVATDYGWDTEEFLANTCRKAGLPVDAWKEGAKIQKFTAFVFDEREAGIGE